MDRGQRNALLTTQRIAEAIIAVVNETPEGAPAERLYLPLTDLLSRDEFRIMMCALTAAQRIHRRGDRYYPAPPRRDHLRQGVSTGRDRRCNSRSTSARLPNNKSKQ